MPKANRPKIADPITLGAAVGVLATKFAQRKQSIQSVSNVDAAAAFLVVTSSVWGMWRRFRDKDGKTVSVGSYQEARDYAEANGFKGIKINYSS
jgi:hypothetical protein